MYRGVDVPKTGRTLEWHRTWNKTLPWKIANACCNVEGDILNKNMNFFPEIL